ncbi:hypothetical protein KEJ47_08990 [Candidatus Bathyarchaeota archaeon]|nr:hypothetical protein [Candidatus Bathyarchaeota archaeon]
MPQKIDNPLTSGLPAKILFLSYIQPRTGYSLGQMIYQIKKGIPPTSKIYSWCKPLIEQGYLERVEDGYRTKSNKIVEAIENILREKNLTLTSTEKRLVTKLLDSEKFRGAVNILGGKLGELNVVKVVCTFLVQGAVSIMYRKRKEKEDRVEISEDEFDRLARLVDIKPPEELVKIIEVMALPENLKKICEKLFEGKGLPEDYYEFLTKKFENIEPPSREKIYKLLQNLIDAFILLELLPNSLLSKLEMLDEDLRLMQYAICLTFKK